MRRGRWLAAVVSLVLALAATGPGYAGAPRLANAQTLVGLPGRQDAALVTDEGDVRFADGSRLTIELAQPAVPRAAAPVQRLRDGWMPILETLRDGPAVRVVVTASAFAGPVPGHLLEVALSNKTDAAVDAVLSLRADHPGRLLAASETGFHQGGSIFALCEATAGTLHAGQRQGFDRRGGKALPNWGQPKRRCDPAFRNIVAGFAEPATYRLQVDPNRAYVVAIGLCESHWGEAGQRIVDFLIEGKHRLTTDPIKEHGQHEPYVHRFPAQDLNGDGVIELTAVANRKSPDPNSILNVLWLFAEADAKDLSDDDILAGRANRRAACYIDCGAEEPGQAALLDYRVRLEPKAGATLSIRKPSQPLPAKESAKLLRPGREQLVDAAQQAWTKALERAAPVRLADADAMACYKASLAVLLMLHAQDSPRGAFVPGPGLPFDAEEAAIAAEALDRAGFRREAQAILDDLFAREALAGWEATGRAIVAAVEHHELAADKAWLERVYPSLLKHADRIARARAASKWFTKDEAALTWGLLPERTDGVPSAACTYADSLWAAQALDQLARTAAAMGRADDAGWLATERDELVAALRRSMDRSYVLAAVRMMDEGVRAATPAGRAEDAAWTAQRRDQVIAALATSLAEAVRLCGDAGELTARPDDPASGPLLPTAALLPRPILPDPHGTIEVTLARLTPPGVQGDVLSPRVACEWLRCHRALGHAEEVTQGLAALVGRAAPTRAWPETIHLPSGRSGGRMPSARAAAGFVVLCCELAEKPPR